MSDLVLEVNGDYYSGWKKIRVQRGIEQISGTCELSVSERWPDQMSPRPIRPGDACTVSVDGETVITGFVDDLDLSYDDKSHSVRVAGRDRTGDLVDCSVLGSSGEWHNIGLLKLAEILCGPFEVTVKSQTDLGVPFTTFAIQEGETAFEALDRASRMRGVLLLADGQGGLALTRAGKAGVSQVTLKQGENILAADGHFSHLERYSVYHVKGQRRGTDEDVGMPEAINELKSVVTDNGVRRHRPLVVLAEDLGNGITYLERAMWERNIRIGRSIRSIVTVQGWREQGDSGDLWAPNRLVSIQDPWQRLDTQMLIASVTFYLDTNGSTTELELAPPAAFDILPEAEHAKKTGSQESGLPWL